MSTPLRIRMYQAGFGDCFVLFVPTSAGEKIVLVDCGSLGGGEPKFKDVVPRMLADVAAARGAGATAHFDVIIATHRHKDHIGGFDQDAWKDVTAGEVWMPWTERPDDPVALRIRSAQERLARALAAVPTRDDGVRALAENAITNEKARARLLELGGDNMRWIACEGPGTNRFESPLLPGVGVFVLGPLRDEATFKDLEPPDDQNFAQRLALAGGSEESSDERAAFPPQWCLPAGHASLRRIKLLRQDIEDIERVLPDAQFELLALNDNLINSTSIMLMLKIGETHLLLPGDAQWSTWRAAFADPARRDLLAKTDFYKVGHHASENATPIEFAEEVMKDRTDCISMASWKKRANWARIPEPHLVAGLKKLGPFADHATVPAGPTFTKGPGGFYIEATL